ncbi:RNA polymerase sigma factor [Planctomycetota bacterium]
MKPKGKVESGGQLDAAAFSRYYNAYADQLYALGYSYFRNADTAEELIQEAFIGLFKAMKSGKTIEKPLHYLVRILRNRASSRISRSRLEPSLDQISEPPAETQRPDEQAISGEERQRLWDMVARLPQEQREVVYLRISRQMSFEQIHQTLMAPLGTIQQRYYSAMDKLREMSGGDCEQ